MDVSPSNNITLRVLLRILSASLNGADTFMSEDNPAASEVAVGAAKTGVGDTDQDLICLQPLLGGAALDLAGIVATEDGEIVSGNHDVFGYDDVLGAQVGGRRYSFWNFVRSQYT